MSTRTPLRPQRPASLKKLPPRQKWKPNQPKRKPVPVNLLHRAVRRLQTQRAVDAVVAVDADVAVVAANRPWLRRSLPRQARELSPKWESSLKRAPAIPHLKPRTKVQSKLSPRPSRQLQGLQPFLPLCLKRRGVPRKELSYSPSDYQAPAKAPGSNAIIWSRFPATWCVLYSSMTCANSAFRISSSPIFAPCSKRA